MPVLTPERLERHAALVAELRGSAEAIAQVQKGLGRLIAIHNAALGRAYALQAEVLDDIEALASAGLGTPALGRLQAAWSALSLPHLTPPELNEPIGSAADALASLPLDG